MTSPNAEDFSGYVLGGMLLLSLTAAFPTRPRSHACASRICAAIHRGSPAALPRLRFRWERGELWTETRFEFSSATKAFSRTRHRAHHRRVSGHLHSHVDGVPVFRAAKRSIYSCGSATRALSRAWLAQARFASAQRDTGVETVTQDSAMAPISTRARELSGTVASAICP